MQRTLWSTLVCCMVLVAPASSLFAAPARASGADLVILRTGLGVAENLATQVAGQATQSLPLGLLDRGGHTLYNAESQTDGRTLVQVIDVATARTLRSMKVPGAFSTIGGDYAEGAITPYGPSGYAPPAFSPGRSLFDPLGTSIRAGVGSSSATARPLSLRMPSPARAGFPADGSQILRALSFNARWLALRDTSMTGDQSRFIIIDTERMRVVADHTLGGQFGLDAITADGKVLYLIQSLPAVGYGVYQVRSFSVARNALDSRVIVERGEKPGAMIGEAWTRVWSPDGSWLYTLYVEPNGHAFVHALNLQARRTRCLDFPVISSNVALMAHFTLSVMPDGRALVAVNPVLGVAVVIQSLPLGHARLARLTQRAGGPLRTEAGAAMSADGRTVFVATGAGVWAIDTRMLTLRQMYARDQEIASVALSQDGKRLYALAPASGQIAVLNAANGTVVDGMQPVAAAWAIEGIVGQP